MNHEFWHQKWKDDDLGFHESKANHLLVSHFDDLAVSQGSRVLVPLCGKTVDIGWLLSKGFQVAGVELSEKAVEQLFQALGTEPDISVNGQLKHYRAPIKYYRQRDATTHHH